MDLLLTGLEKYGNWWSIHCYYLKTKQQLSFFSFYDWVWGLSGWLRLLHLPKMWGSESSELGSVTASGQWSFARILYEHMHTFVCVYVFGWPLMYIATAVGFEHWRGQALVQSRTRWQGWSHTQKLHTDERTRVSHYVTALLLPFVGD